MSQELASVYEKIGAMDAKISAAHSRMDEFKLTVGEDLTEIKKDLKDLIAKENKRTGWVAAMVFIGSIITGVLGFFFGRG